MQPITRFAAAKQGLARYFTGKPCKRGHVSERYVSSGSCVECQREDQERTQRTIQQLRRRALEDAEKQQD